MSDFLCVRRCETSIRAAGLSEQVGNVCRYGMFKEGTACMGAFDARPNRNRPFSRLTLGLGKSDHDEAM